MSLAAIPILAVEEYGFFALVLSLQLFVLGAIDALLLTPGVVKYSKKYVDDEFKATLPLVFSVSLVIGSAAAGCALLFVDEIPGVESYFVPVVVIVSGLSVVLKEWVKSYFLLNKRSWSIVMFETFSTGGLLLGVLLMTYLIKLNHVSGVDYVYVLVVPVVFHAFTAMYLMHSSYSVFSISTAVSDIRIGLTSLYAAKVGWLQSQSYIYFVTGMLSVGVLGALAASRMVFAPLQSILTGLNKGLLPAFAFQVNHGDFRSLLRKVNLIVLFYSFSTFAFGLLCWLLVTYFFHEYLDSYNISDSYLFLWCFVFMLAGARSLVVTAIRAHGRFDVLLRNSIAGAVLAFSLVPIFIYFLGGAGALVALVLVELLALILAYKSLLSFRINAFDNYG